MSESSRRFDPYFTFRNTFLSATDLSRRQFEALAEDHNQLMDYGIALDTSFHNARLVFRQVKHFLIQGIPAYKGVKQNVESIDELSGKLTYLERELDTQADYELADWDYFFRHIAESEDEGVQALLEDSVDLLNERLYRTEHRFVNLSDLVDSCRAKYDFSDDKGHRHIRTDPSHIEHRKKTDIDSAFFRVGRLPLSFLPKKGAGAPVHYLFKGRVKTPGSLALKTIRKAVEHDLLIRYYKSLKKSLGENIKIDLPEPFDEYVTANDVIAFTLVVPFHNMAESCYKPAENLINAAVLEPLRLYTKKQNNDDPPVCKSKFGCIYTDVSSTDSLLGVEHQATNAINYFYHHMVGPLNHSLYEMNRLVSPSPGFMNSDIVRSYIENSVASHGKNPRRAIVSAYRSNFEKRLERLERLCDSIMDNYEGVVPGVVSSIKNSIKFYWDVPKTNR